MTVTSAPPAAPSVPPALRRVLVADDEHLVAEGLAGALRRLEIEVVGPVSDGQQAIDLAREAQPDLALLDIRMPVLDGLLAAQALWHELEVPGVIVSAYASAEYVDGAVKAGVFGYLLKPATADHLRVGLTIAWTRATAALAARKRIDQLERNLQARRTVEQAKWRLIELRGITEPDAHNLLQRIARRDRRRLVDVAAEVLATPSHPLLDRAVTAE